jgi:hypothetical protein
MRVAGSVGARKGAQSCVVPHSSKLTAFHFETNLFFVFVQKNGKTRTTLRPLNTPTMLDPIGRFCQRRTGGVWGTVKWAGGAYTALDNSRQEVGVPV